MYCPSLARQREWSFSDYRTSNRALLLVQLSLQISLPLTRYLEFQNVMYVVFLCCSFIFVKFCYIPVVYNNSAPENIRQQFHVKFNNVVFYSLFRKFHYCLSEVITEEPGSQGKRFFFWLKNLRLLLVGSLCNISPGVNIGKVMAYNTWWIIYLFIRYFDAM